jgi:galactonate dehydratase
VSPRDLRRPSTAWAEPKGNGGRAGGIFECRLIAGMAEACYCSIAPHNLLGPISLAAGIQLAASVPNFLCQEQVSLGDGYIKNPFKVEKAASS